MSETDTLAGSFPRARELLPQAAQHRFPGHHPLHVRERAGEYVDALLAGVTPARPK
jgi:hypothetical protein